MPRTRCARSMYRNTTPATPVPKIQPASRCGNINSVDQLRHPRSDAYSAEQVLLNKQQIWCGGADLHCYRLMLPHWPAGCILGASVAGVVFLYTPRDDCCSDVVAMPCERSTRIAYSMLDPDDSSAVTWSAAVNLSFSMTPRTRKLDTRSVSGHGGGSATFRFAEKTISFVLPRFSFKLLSASHACRCSISLWHVPVVMPGTTK